VSRLDRILHIVAHLQGAIHNRLRRFIFAAEPNLPLSHYALHRALSQREPGRTADRAQAVKPRRRRAARVKVIVDVDKGEDACPGARGDVSRDVGGEEERGRGRGEGG
jgi:hypothetical protein